MRKVLDIAIGVGLWFALGGFLGGCGDIGSGTDRCNNNCHGAEQCVQVLLEMASPRCYPWKTCQVPAYTCVDPARAHMSVEPEAPPQQ